MTPTSASLSRLARLSRTMSHVTTAGIALIVVAMTLVFVIPDWTRNFALSKLGTVAAALPYTPASRLAAALVTAIPVGVMIYGLLSVRALFVDFGRGSIFTEAVARRLQTFAVTILAQAPLGPVTAAALSIALTRPNPPGQRLLHLALSINDYFAFVVGAVLLAVATIMREAARLADENASFV